MKKFYIILIAVFFIAACKTNDKKNTGVTPTKEEIEKAKTDSTQFTTIEWIDSPIKNLGKLKKNKEVEITFHFKNSGNKILVIEDVKAGCGCTIPEKPQHPFAPGEEGVIKAKFNGSGSGTVTKQITVTANTTPTKDHVLTFTGEIAE